MRADPTVTAEWLSSQVPGARLRLDTGPGNGNAAMQATERRPEYQYVTILTNLGLDVSLDCVPLRKLDPYCSV